MPPDNAENREEPVKPRDAASLILLRDGADGPEVLMGRRPLASRFMPGVYVFPGGAVDRGDFDLQTERDAAGAVIERLGRKAPPPLARALLWTALRETWEETGLMLGGPGAAQGTDGCPALDAYASAGLAPDLGALDYLMRAVTPSYVPIRFNTRFFIADGAAVSGELRQVTELEDVRWLSVREAETLNIVNVTGLVLEHAAKYWHGDFDGAQDRPTPMFTQRVPGEIVLREE